MLQESCVNGHHVYRADFVIGAVFNCEREPTVAVKKPEYAEVVGHVPDDLAGILSREKYIR